MKDSKAHLIAFASAWAVSIAGLLCIGLFSEYGPTSGQELLRVIPLYGYCSGIGIAAAWIIFVLPYWWLFLRRRSTRLGLHAVVAGFLVAGFVIAATYFTPVSDDSWRFTAPIAFIAAALGATVLQRLDSRPNTTTPN